MHQTRPSAGSNGASQFNCMASTERHADAGQSAMPHICMTLSPVMQMLGIALGGRYWPHMPWHCWRLITVREGEVQSKLQKAPVTRARFETCRDEMNMIHASSHAALHPGILMPIRGTRCTRTLNFSSHLAEHECGCCLLLHGKSQAASCIAPIEHVSILTWHGIMNIRSHHGHGSICGFRVRARNSIHCSKAKKCLSRKSFEQNTADIAAQQRAAKRLKHCTRPWDIGTTFKALAMSIWHQTRGAMNRFMP